ncbi:MAG: hypothetical protein ACOYJS_00380 [Acutalibacteraceae bacterium]|jgi:DNA polymerase-3 subunit delta'
MSFPLAGNLRVKLAVENALRERRLPHAVLIEGDIGTGRHTLADFLSTALVCEGSQIPCGICDTCRLANAKNHPDIKVIAPEEGKKNIVISMIRQLKNDAYIKPHKANRKVFIIDFADTMNEQSQNAFLKVLEEPPADVFFILIAESKASFLDTIISRCIVFSLYPPTADEGLEYIKSTTSFDTDEIEKALIGSRNNIGKALMILNGGSDTKTAAAAKEFLENMLRGNEWGMLEVLAPFEKSRIDTDRLFRDLKYCAVEEIKKNPESRKAAALSRFYRVIEQLQSQLIANINLSLLFSCLTAKAKECRM